MASSATINPDGGLDVDSWLEFHELPLERALKVAALLGTRLVDSGMDNVRVDFTPPDRFTIDMEQNVGCAFDQFHEIGQFLFSIIWSTGNEVVARWIPTFKIHPALHLEFQLVQPIVYNTTEEWRQQESN